MCAPNVLMLPSEYIARKLVGRPNVVTVPTTKRRARRLLALKSVISSLFPPTVLIDTNTSVLIRPHSSSVAALSRPSTLSRQIVCRKAANPDLAMPLRFTLVTLAGIQGVRIDTSRICSDTCTASRRRRISVLTPKCLRCSLGCPLGGAGERTPFDSWMCNIGACIPGCASGRAP